MINEDSTIRTRVFRKETHTDQYLNFDSNHPLEHKRGVVRTLTHRARSIVSDLGERKERRDTGIQRLPRLDAGRDKGRDQGGEERGRGSDNGNNWSEEGEQEETGDYPVHQRLLRRVKENFWGIRYTNAFQAYEHSAPAVSTPERPSGEGQSCGPSVQDKL